MDSRQSQYDMPLPFMGHLSWVCQLTSAGNEMMIALSSGPEKTKH